MCTPGCSRRNRLEPEIPRPSQRTQGIAKEAIVAIYWRWPRISSGVPAAFTHWFLHFQKRDFSTGWMVF